jgi:hypothetical protein
VETCDFATHGHADGTVANPLVTQFRIRLRQAPEVHDVQGRHIDRSVILLCTWWYLACGVNVGNLDEMMAAVSNHADLKRVQLDHFTNWS